MGGQPQTTRTPPSLGYATFVGVGVGAIVLLLFLVGGYFVANWSIQDLLGHLTPTVLGWMAIAGGVAVATFALPVTLYLRLRVVTPVVVLLLIVVAWVGIGVGQGIPMQASFGLAAYAFGLAPLYLVLFLLFGGAEHMARR